MSRLFVIIPARSGSIGVPNKNILSVSGVPVLVRAYRVARSLPLDARIIVSTDSSQYLSLLIDEGYSDSALRPAELSTVNSLIIDTIKYELARVGASDEDLVALLEPSFVGRRKPNLCKAIEQVCNNEVDSCFGAHPVPASFHYAKQFSRNGTLVECIGPININRQQLSTSYIRSGEFYLSRVSLVRTQHSMLGGRLEMFETALPFVNIDNAEDVKRAIKISSDDQD